MVRTQQNRSNEPTIKTFRAESYQAGLRMIREQFGDQTTILHTREIDQRRFFGFKRAHFVEITAAVQPTPMQAPSTPKPIERNNPPENPIRNIEPKTETTHPGTPFLNPKVLSNLNNIPQQTSPQTQPKPSRTRLVQWRQMSFDELNPSLLQRSLITKLEECVPFRNPFEQLSRGPIKMAFTGSTGVGKTSSIAKIAAHFKQKEYRTVGLLALDPFHTGSSESLQRYAQILDLTYRSATDPHSMDQALSQMRDCELILIDTPGVNPTRLEKLRLLQSCLFAAEIREIQLVLSATSSTSVLCHSTRCFELFQPTGIILTRLDENIGLPDLYRFLKENSVPLSFFTSGQNPAEDIELATPVRLASLA